MVSVSKMKTSFLAFSCTLLAFLGTSSASYPKAPGLSYLYTVNITGGTPIIVGPGPRGNRIVVPIIGGSFSGPKLGNGESNILVNETSLQ